MKRTKKPEWVRVVEYLQPYADEHGIAVQDIPCFWDEYNDVYSAIRPSAGWAYLHPQLLHAISFGEYLEVVDKCGVFLEDLIVSNFELSML